MAGKVAILRFFLFCAFFSIGVGAFWVSVAIKDVVQYYTLKGQLASAEQAIVKLQILIDDYESIIKRIEAEPNTTRRLETVVFGTEPNSKDTAYPEVKAQEYAAAKNVLTRSIQTDVNEPVVPTWVRRCSRRIPRITLFLAGAALTIISFVWFGYPAKRRNKPEIKKGKQTCPMQTLI